MIGGEFQLRYDDISYPIAESLMLRENEYAFSSGRAALYHILQHLKNSHQVSDVSAAVKKRKQNEEYLLKGLKNMNLSPLIPVENGAIPLFLPLYLKNRDIVRKRFFIKKYSVQFIGPQFNLNCRWKKQWQNTRFPSS